ncbi:radical SAM family heme chaperone HemW [Anaerobranca gottschalkii]|uniref:Heme chaperone HemW n=1 Tax=Anaerobranca gottschalkii DSM 13577 TaxID=1120990 RepID=A0A1H9YCJ6_9FIRM|nr:radical SAM family heme chaperone HemW [Anaerobranca gottschalkii]SES66556.1 oxygen-independent coproporphyrinogen-3 oxidase [Anaerobranca gottschalkii DSM 13577]
MAGIYIHIPFCLKKCYYCDFISFPDIEKENEYTQSLIKEIHLQKDILKTKEWSTVFFGGGTPSLLSLNNLGKIIDELALYIDFNKIKEFTIEANPKTLTSEKLQFYKVKNINRLSLGVQTFNLRELKAIGRIHTPQDAIDTVQLAKGQGFDRISIDLIYGLPFQTLETLMESLEITYSLGINHISFYGLQVEEDTPLERMILSKELTIPDEEIQENLYLAGVEFLIKRGFKHYEVSNFALGNNIALHNYNYWLYKDYLGFGVSSYSKLGNKRYANTDNLDEYCFKLNQNNLPIKEVEILTNKEMEFEQKMLSLRTHRGLKLDEGKNIEVVKDLIYNELAYIEKDRLKLTAKGYLVSNEIINKLC